MKYEEMSDQDLSRAFGDTMEQMLEIAIATEMRASPTQFARRAQLCKLKIAMFEIADTGGE